MGNNSSLLDSTYDNYTMSGGAEPWEAEERAIPEAVDKFYKNKGGRHSGPHYMTKLTDDDKKVPLKEFICNWPKCTMGPGKKPAHSKRLCPYCNKVGYCCVYCLESDIDRHVAKECQQNIKKAIMDPKTKMF